MARLTLASLATAVAVFFSSVAHGAVVGHASIPVWAEPAPTDATSHLAVRFKPMLDIVNGCQPYPVVDAAGNTGGGLKPTGGSASSCGDRNKAQVYARSGGYNDAYAIMYAWYMPKDSPSTGLGHRHDWEHVVVWLDNNNPATARIVAAAVSAHGKYKKSFPLDGSYVADGVATKVSYKSTWPLNHELSFTKSNGAKQSLIQWEQMTPEARTALETTDFGAAGVPFKGNFGDNLAKAYFK